MRDRMKDTKTDFIEYLEVLADVFKSLQKLDAAGLTLKHVFLEKKKWVRQVSFRNWIINLDVWGSYNPLSAECYDIQMTRILAYTKIQQIRKQITNLLEQKKPSLEGSGQILQGLNM